MPAMSFETPPSTTPFSPANTSSSSALPPVRELYTFNTTSIQRSRLYLSSSQIEALRPKPGTTEEARQTQIQLSACTWIMQVGHQLQFPLRTMTTAMILHLRFLLFNTALTASLDPAHPDSAAAALFVATKIEDTLKKSKELLEAGWSLRYPTKEPPSDLEEASRRVIQLERSILEASSFDFRSRHAHPFLIKFCRRLDIETSIAQKAWDVAKDAYRTFAAVRAAPQTIAIAAILLACRLEEREVDITFEFYETARKEVLEVVDDVLDLYMNHASASTVGCMYEANVYLELRIELNRERKELANGYTNGNGYGHGYYEAEAPVEKVLPVTVKQGSARGTVRFMIDPERERVENALLEASVGGVDPEFIESRAKGVEMVNGAAMMDASPVGLL